MAMYIMGNNVHFIAGHEYYNVRNTGYHSVPAAAHLMYGGALYYLIAGCCWLAYGFARVVYPGPA
jgi:hypothetical protein